ncbi:hypothetical protein D7V21_14445 [Acinetobacter guerrae]|uniref:Molybdenum ABC transporter substrate-binding protein n=1 Tax=Acinetobacter guerrae TaxID=1843371 RepID=A0A3A8EAW8_9GAMM|nr:hypothetical protein [Acinetobacter guerrae]RKG31268.1 hypothetical protein D7V21_14445 [Acinetobacter guerrae]
MKKLGLLSLVLAGVTFTAVGCASEAGLHASGSTQASASPEAATEAQGGVAVQADAATQAQPVQASPEAPQITPESAPVQ